MQGTTSLVQSFLKDLIPEDTNIHRYYSMVNSAKCSGADDKQDMVSPQLYANCQDFTIKELKILKPQLLITQGVKAAETLNSLPMGKLLKKQVIERMEVSGIAVKWISSLVEEYIRVVQFDDGDVVLLLRTPHPASRNGQWQLFQRIALEPLVLFVNSALVTME